MTDTGAATRPKYKIKINQAWCKGCGICFSFCPKGILVPEGFDQKAAVKDEVLCIDCKMCEYHCPDFAIQVVPDEASE